MTEHKHQSVSQVTRQIKTLLETSPSLERVFIYGEISNFKHHSRGHMYFTLKDDRARISAVMFAGNNRALRFQPENGMKVFISGNISVYEPYGQYQLYVKQMEPDGIGQLYLAYEQLKGKLEREGYFDPMLKKSRYLVFLKKLLLSLRKQAQLFGTFTRRSNAAIQLLLLHFILLLFKDLMRFHPLSVR